MKISIMTCDREPSYLSQTVETIPLLYELEYIVQGQIVQPRPGDLIPIDKKYKQDPNRHRDGQYNYAMSLLHTTDGLIIEDDVQFSRNFETYFNNVLEQLPQGRYAIALYSCYQWDNYPGGSFIVDYPVDMYYGTQAMLYDIETAREFGEYLKNNIGKELWDMALKTFIKTINPKVKLYATRKSLVQHMGDISSIATSGHKCPNFIDDLI